MVNPKPATARWLDEESQVFIVVQTNLKPHQAAFCHGKPHQRLTDAHEKAGSWFPNHMEIHVFTSTAP